MKFMKTPSEKNPHELHGLILGVLHVILGPGDTQPSVKLGRCNLEEDPGGNCWSHDRGFQKCEQIK